MCHERKENHQRNREKLIREKEGDRKRESESESEKEFNEMSPSH